MKIGYSRIDITPTEPVPLAGYGNTSMRISQNVLSPLCSACLVITDDNGNTAMLVHNDLIHSADWFSDPIRLAIEEATGVPFDHIMVASTHTHAAPPIYYEKVEGILPYRKICIAAAIQAARDALADRAPAHFAAGSVRAENLAFCRHYVMEDGTVKKTPGKKANPVAHADPADDEVQLMRWCREGKKDILLVNFNIHPTFLGRFKDKLISSDAPGALRSYLESNQEVLVAYFTGAAGNQTGRSQIASLDHGLELAEYGQALGQVIEKALPAMQAKQVGPIRITTQIFIGQSNKERIELLEQAEEIAQIHSKQGEEAAKPLLSKYGIASVWEAYAIRRRYAAPPTLDAPLSALSL